jgi:hypothetical protein
MKTSSFLHRLDMLIVVPRIFSPIGRTGQPQAGLRETGSTNA